ncbi:MAG: hypothetical protein K6F77_09455 [Lachnospiraceae bacterium]|nr:hypothetical protein [Lachnospiraceae bacterium]
MKNLFNRLTKAFAVLLVFSMVSVSFTGCGEKKEDSKKVEKNGDTSSEEESKDSLVSDSSESDEYIHSKEKNETVNVKANEYGEVKEITVSDTLKDFKEGKLLKDVSDLSEIKNKEGDENYYILDEGDNNTEYAWENHGNDITYEGDYAGELPIGVKVTYYLDDKEIKAKDLAGKSGKVKIRFDYENDAYADVEDEKTQVPFIFLSAVALNDEKFSDYKVKNGKVVDLQGESFFVGFGIPGLKDSLGIDELEEDLKKLNKDDGDKEDKDIKIPDKKIPDIKIPDYSYVSFDAKNFSLDFTLTIANRGLFSGMKDKTIKSLLDFTKSMKKMGKASKKLCKASKKLKDGSEEFKDYLGDFVDGVDSLSDGADELSDGVSALDDNSPKLRKGVKEYTKGVKKMYESLNSVDLSAYEQVPEMAEILMLINGLKNGLKELSSAGKELNKGLKEYTNGVSKVSDGSKEFADATNELSDAGYELSDGYDELDDGIGEFSEGLEKFNNKAVKKISELEGKDLEVVVKNIKKLKKAEKAYGILTKAYDDQDTSLQIMIETEEIEK